MFDEETRAVTLLCENSLMKSVIDHFGEKVKTSVVDREHFTAEVDVSVSPTFFGWVVSFAGRMKIAEPEDIKNRYTDFLGKILEKPLK
jgi:tRNA U54 and U55 pseudouridine synthase Pus10